jgi:chromosome segregation ATPase
MPEIDKRIGLLRLLLADVDGRAQQQQALVTEYRAQIGRIVEATVRQAGDVGQALSAMAEVDERLAGVEAAGRRLAQLRQRASRELEALLLTKRVAEARAQLDELEGRREALAQQLAELDERHPRAAPAAHPASADEVEADALRALNAEVSGEIQRLQRLILEASQRAARSVSPGA